MNNLSDTLTIGLVLVLLFGSIALYLYTRIQQSEQKINLLESILLDLKMSNEIKEYTELPADDMEESVSDRQSNGASEVRAGSYTPYEDAVAQTVVNVSPEKQNASEPSMVHDNAANNGYQSLDDVLQEASDAEQHKVDLVESENQEDSSEVKPNYEYMSLKELQALTKSRGITGVPVKKSAYVDALKASDLQSVPLGLPGSLGVGANSFIETSASFSNEP